MDCLNDYYNTDHHITEKSHPYAIRLWERLYTMQEMRNILGDRDCQSRRHNDNRIADNNTSKIIQQFIVHPCIGLLSMQIFESKYKYYLQIANILRRRNFPPQCIEYLISVLIKHWHDTMSLCWDNSSKDILFSSLYKINK